MSAAVAVQDWLDTNLSQTLSIWVGEPEVHQEKRSMIGVKSYMSYCIHYKQLGRDVVTVRHRYSDFENVRVELRDRYHPLGILVPSLPPKHALTSAMTSFISTDWDDLFIKERTLGLTLFCESVVLCPWLRHDAAWKAFLRGPAPSAGPASPSDQSFNDENVGEMQLVACLQQLQMPLKPLMSEKLDILKEEVNIMERNAKVLLERLQHYQKCLKALQAAQQQVHAGIETYGEFERQLRYLQGKSLHEASGNVLGSAADTTQATVQSMKTFFEAKNDVEKESEYHFGLSVIAALEQDVLLAESFKELFRVHDELANMIESLYSKAKSATKPEAQQELQKQLEEKEACLSAFYTGFVFFSLPFAARQRAALMRKCFAAHVVAVSATSSVVFKACLDYFQRQQLSALHALDATSAEYVKIGVRPPAKVTFPEDTTATTTAGGSGGGMQGLFQRALALVRGNPANAPNSNITTLASQVAVHSASGNPLATRRGSAIKNNMLEHSNSSSSHRDLLKLRADEAAALEIKPPAAVEEPQTPKKTEEAKSPVVMTEKTKALLDQLTSDGTSAALPSKASTRDLWG